MLLFHIDDAVSPSTVRLMCGVAPSFEILGPGSLPVEALAAVHYFATALDNTPVIVFTYLPCFVM